MTFRRSVFGGIVDEIGEYLNKTHRIAIDNERLVAQRDADLVSPRLYQRVTRFKGLLDHCGETDMFLLELDFARSDPGNLQKIIDEANEVVNLPVHQ